MAIAFKAGDKVEFVVNYPDTVYKRVSTGDKGTVKHVGYDLITVEMDKGGSESVFDHRIKLAAPFSIGDKVTVKGWETRENPAWEGRTGTITHVSGASASVEFDKNKGLYSSGGFDFNYLVPAVEFTFTDIKKGDKIRRTKTYPSGTTDVREGVVGTVSSWNVADENNDFILAYDTDDRNAEKVTLELLERPEPVKEVWEDAKVGDVFKRVENSSESTVTRVENHWLVTYAYSNRQISTSMFPLESTHLLETEAGRTVTKVSA